MFLFEHARNFYGRFERPISSLSLVAGFVFDALTLKRVDTLWENMWILGHILIVGVFMVLIHSREIEEGDEANPRAAHFWYVNIIQFFFGGILSTYIVFYFRSADIFVTWPFILILAVAFIANESLKRHYIRLSFQISLFFLSIYSFAIFLVPVVMHQIGAVTFIISGLLSLVLIKVFIVILFYYSKDKFSESRRMIYFLIGSIVVLVNFLYFTNLIPPIPLSLKDGVVAHSVRKNADDNYDLVREDHGWQSYFHIYQDYNQPTNAPVYAYSAVFSPKGLNITILHEWQRYDLVRGEWVTESIISLPVIGGREGGFRTYSKKSNLAYGKWRVNITTDNHKTIGVLRFNLLPADKQPELVTETK